METDLRATAVGWELATVEYLLGENLMGFGVDPALASFLSAVRILTGRDNLVPGRGC